MGAGVVAPLVLHNTGRAAMRATLVQRPELAPWVTVVPSSCIVQVREA